MYALKRIGKSFALLIFLLLALVAAESGLTNLAPDLREPALVLRAIGLIAGVIYILCYLFAPLVRRGHRTDATDERPWRFLLAIGGATVVIWLSTMILAVIDGQVLSNYAASTPSAENVRRFDDGIWRLHVMWMTFTVIAAAVYLYLGFPRRLVRDKVKDGAAKDETRTQNGK
jgi:hypothetical protein